MSSCQPHNVKRRLFKDAGRACPVDYRIPADAFAGAPEAACDVLYVVGGLYGNPFALDAVERMAAAEDPADDVLVVFNGDAHWFDKTAENFAAIEERIQRYLPLVGNVEAELRRQLKTCCSPLPEPYRQVALDHYYHEMDINEIAAKTGKNKKTLQTQIYRAKGMLRERMRKEDLRYG